jgi:hypothetical protein
MENECNTTVPFCTATRELTQTKRKAFELSPLSHPPMRRVLASIALLPNFGSLAVRFFRLRHGGGLAAPTWLSNIIGVFWPMAPWGRSSL